MEYKQTKLIEHRFFYVLTKKKKTTIWWKDVWILCNIIGYYGDEGVGVML